ncbi:unnamed protein product, partial [Prorocentrum cordatum]
TAPTTPSTAREAQRRGAPGCRAWQPCWRDRGAPPTTTAATGAQRWRTCPTAPTTPSGISAPRRRRDLPPEKGPTRPAAPTTPSTSRTPRRRRWGPALHGPTCETAST